MDSTLQRLSAVCAATARLLSEVKYCVVCSVYCESVIAYCLNLLCLRTLWLVARTGLY